MGIRRRTLVVWFSVGLAHTAWAGDPMFAISDQVNSNLLTLDAATGAQSTIVPITGYEQLAGLTMDLNGDLYSIDGKFDALSDRLFRIDAVTGQGTVVGPTGFNWNFRDLEIHPQTGVLYGMKDNAIYQFNKTTGAATLISPIGGAPELIQSTAIAIDNNGNAYVVGTGNEPLLSLNLTTGKATFIGNLYISGSSLRDIAFDNANVLHGIDFKGNVFTVDTATATATFQYQTGKFTGIAFTNFSTCAGSAQTYGAGCPGSGGLIPSLDTVGCPQAGSALSLSISNALGGSTSLLIFGLQQGSTPIGGGCSLLVNPLLPLMRTLPLAGSGPGNGGITLGGTMPPTATGATFTMQVFVSEPTLPLGYATTNGVQLTFP